MEISPSAVGANIEGSEALAARVTSILDRLRRQSGERIGEELTKQYLTYGSLLLDRSVSARTETRQLSPWSMCSAGSALLQAMTDVHATPGIPTNGVAVILVFATPAWRLLILTSSSESPSLSDGELFVSERLTTTRIFHAKLLAQPARSEETSSRVLSAWHAVVQEPGVEDTSSFLSTVLRLALLRSTLGSKASK
jgi:hypothetical protein